jgi:hypothetical protein
MNAPHVIFRVHSASPLLASTRYRAMMPALGLEALGYQCTVTDGALSPQELRAAHCVVFAKAIRDRDRDLARNAHEAGAAIAIDLCDFMFAPEYAAGAGPRFEANFREMAQWASAIVTTGPAMGEILRPYAPRTPLHFIPDQLETPALLAQVLKRWPASPQRIGAGAASWLRRLVRPPSAKPSRQERTIIWFGNHGSDHSAFGIGALSAVAPHLSAAAKIHSLKLLVVSNSREKFDRFFGSADFPTEYREWSPDRIFADLDEADICLIPIPREAFAMAKSANRVALALSRGVAVVADDFPALAEFSQAVISGGDWAGGLKLYLEDESRRQADIAAGQAIIDRFCTPKAVARRWADLLEGIPKRGA